MGTPRRHGIDWPGNIPSPLPAAQQRIGAVRTGSSQSVPLPSSAPTSATGQQPHGSVNRQSNIIPVAVMDAFYQNLPKLGVQQLALVQEVRYSAADVAAGTPFDLVMVEAVPDGLVYIFTDIYTYILAPPATMYGPPVTLPAYAASGYVRFMFKISGRVPMNLDSTVVRGNPAPGVPPALGTGWPYLDTVFGVRRGGGFALYARSSERVVISATVDSAYQCSLQRLGAHVHGFTVPDADFDRVFRTGLSR